MFLAWKGQDGRQLDFDTAVRMASRKGHAEIVRMFLAWEGPGGLRVDPTTYGNNAIQTATEHGHSEIVSMLLAWEGEEGRGGAGP